MQQPCTHLQPVVAFTPTITIRFQNPPSISTLTLPLKTTKATEISDFTLYQNRSFNMAAGEGFEPSQNDP